MFQSDMCSAEIPWSISGASPLFELRSGVGLETSFELAGIYQKEDTLGTIGISKVSEGVIHGVTTTECAKCGREDERKSTARRVCLSTWGSD